MKKKTKGASPVKVGAITAVAAFALFTILAGGGLVEVSREIGIVKWIFGSAGYMLVNKLGTKLLASFAIGAIASFVSSMISYGAAPRPRRARTTQIDFSAKDGELSKTA